MKFQKSEKRYQFSVDKLAVLEQSLGFYDTQRAGVEKFELAIIVAMMANENSFYKVLQLLDESDFNNESTKAVFNAMLYIKNNGLNANLASLVVLNKNGVYNIPDSVIDEIQSIERRFYTNNDTYELTKSCLKLKEISGSIKAKALFIEAYAKIFNTEEKEDVFDVVSRTKSELEEVLSIKAAKISDLKQIATEVAILENKESEQGKKPGVTTGFKRLDDHTGGFGKNNLILIAGRPGMGKTAYVVSTLISYMFKSETKFGFFSLEMSKNELVKRLYSMRTGINLNRITARRWENGQLDDFMMFAKNLPNTSFLIDDIFDLTQIEIQSELLVFKHGVEIIFIDYLQLIEGSEGKDLNEKTGNVSKRLKKLAKKLDVPIIALSQLSRITKRNDGKGKPSIEQFIPDLEDLRDSGSLEQDADMVVFLFRPSYYKDKIEIPNDLENVIKILFKKFRGGSPFNKNFEWKAECAQIIDPKENYNESTKNVNDSSQYPTGEPAPF